MDSRKSSGDSTSGRSGMRQNIKKTATDLLIKQGVHGTSFRDISVQLATTTTNIHYHFGNKERLIDEVVADYVEEAAARHRGIWLNGKISLQEKLEQVLSYNYERYKRFNRARQGGHPWSLIGRLRLEGDALSDTARQSLASFTSMVNSFIVVAVDEAIRSGELREDTPRDDLVLLLLNLVNSSSVFTQDAGGFDRLEHFFHAFSRVVLTAYAPVGAPA